MPLTSKGNEILQNLTKEYGAEKAKQVLYAGKNKGTFTGIDSDERADGEPSWMMDRSDAIHPVQGKSYDMNRTLDEAMYRMDLIGARMDRVDGRSDASANAYENARAEAEESKFEPGRFRARVTINGHTSFLSQKAWPTEREAIAKAQKYIDYMKDQTGPARAVGRIFKW